MPDIVSRVWPEWRPEELLGRGSFGSVYRAVRSGHGHTSYAAIKVIEIPQNPGEVRDLVASGMDDASVRSYFEQRARGVLGEVALMEELKGAPNVVSIEDYQLVERDDGMGWVVLVRMPLLESLGDYYARVGQPDSKEVARLGSEICQALSACHAKGVIHRDVKPENIFRGPYGYLLGDFGIARHLELGGESAHTRAGAYPYMAPEVFAGKGYGASVDTYSLGLVLYRYLNGGRAPFLPTEGAFAPADSERAVALRLAGRPLPAPANADAKLASVVLRAADPDPAKRFGSAAEMGQALTRWAISAASEASARPASQPVASRQAPCGPTGTMRADSAQPSGWPTSQVANGSAAGTYAQPTAQPYAWQQPAQPSAHPQAVGASGAGKGPAGGSRAGRIGLIVAAAVVASILLVLVLTGGNAGCGGSASTWTTEPDSNGPASSSYYLVDDDICTIEVTNMRIDRESELFADLVLDLAITNHTDEMLEVVDTGAGWSVNGNGATASFIIFANAGETTPSNLTLNMPASLVSSEEDTRPKSVEEVESVFGTLEVKVGDEAVYYDVTLNGAAVSYSEPQSEGASEPDGDAETDASNATSYDDLSGEYVTTGSVAGGYLTSATLTDSEMTLVGDLHESNGGSEGASVGDKTWVFKVDEDSQFGYANGEGFHEQSREEFAETLESLAFPALRLTIENGTIVSAKTTS